jgi:hypothetical protein
MKIFYVYIHIKINMYFSLNEGEDLLRIKKEIADLPYTVYFETEYILNFNMIKYRIRRSRWLRPKIEYDYLSYIKGNEKKLSIDFPSISHPDTMLVIPTKPFLHISDFAKNSTDRQWLALFRHVRKLTHIGDCISTHGHGVSWLHIRIEEEPLHYYPVEIYQDEFSLIDE